MLNIVNDNGDDDDDHGDDNNGVGDDTYLINILIYIY